MDFIFRIDPRKDDEGGIVPPFSLRKRSTMCIK